MKLLMTLLSVPVGIAIAVPAHADPGDGPPQGDDETFLSSLQQAGIHFTDPNQAISAGRAVCGLIVRRESVVALLNDLQAKNPGLTLNGAAQFAIIAGKSYCPHQLEPDDNGIH